MKTLKLEIRVVRPEFSVLFSVCLPPAHIQQYRTPIIVMRRNRKAGPGLIYYLFESVCVLHQLHYNNDSRFSYFPVNLSLTFLLIVSLVLIE